MSDGRTRRRGYYRGTAPVHIPDPDGVSRWHAHGSSHGDVHECQVQMATALKGRSLSGTRAVVGPWDDRIVLEDHMVAGWCILVNPHYDGSRCHQHPITRSRRNPCVQARRAHR